VLAFPVILLFYLLVTPGIMETPIPYAMAGVFFMFPIIFFCTLFYTRFNHRPGLLAIQIGLTVLIGGWIYAGLVFNADPVRHRRDPAQRAQHLRGRRLRPRPASSASCAACRWTSRRATMWRLPRPAARAPGTSCCGRVLPNARGPLIVDVCLRIGYTTILLGTLGYFGLGLAPESPDWGTAIKDSSRLLRAYIHPALPPVVALMSFVLGLNLLADALRSWRSRTSPSPTSPAPARSRR
jgi:peptide/nickel transport system permease protein